MITALVCVGAVAFVELGVIVFLLELRRIEKQYTEEVKLPDIRWRDGHDL